MLRTKPQSPLLVVAALFLDKGKILLTRRLPGKHLAGLWEFPGGKIEPGEGPTTALAREIEEELGLAVTVGNIVDVAFHRYDEHDVMLLLYQVTCKEKEAIPSAQEVAEFAYYSADELMDLSITPAGRHLLPRVIQVMKQQQNAASCSIVSNF